METERQAAFEGALWSVNAHLHNTGMVFFMKDFELGVTA